MPLFFLHQLNSSSRYSDLSARVKSSWLPVVITNFIPTFIAPFRRIFFLVRFKCCKMKMHQREGGWKSAPSLQDRWPWFFFFVARPPGALLTESEWEEGPVSQATQVVWNAALSPHLKYSDSSSSVALISPRSTWENEESRGVENNKNKRKSCTPESEQIDISLERINNCRYLCCDAAVFRFRWKWAIVAIAASVQFSSSQ